MNSVSHVNAMETVHTASHDLTNLWPWALYSCYMYIVVATETLCSAHTCTYTIHT